MTWGFTYNEVNDYFGFLCSVCADLVKIHTYHICLCVYTYNCFLRCIYQNTGPFLACCAGNI